MTTLPVSSASGSRAGIRFLLARIVALVAAPAVSLQAAESLTLVLESAPEATGPWTPRASQQVTAGSSAEIFRLRVEAASEWRPPSNFVAIPAGRFVMGTPSTEASRGANEGPEMSVTLSRGFWMSRYEVTQAEYAAVMGQNPSLAQAPNLPVDQVSWPEAVEYCEKLTAQERAAGRLPVDREYRLPTEAEWEYACRAGTRSATSFGDRLTSRDANFDGTLPYGEGAEPGLALGGTTKVGSYPPNAWGLYDMHGNVWEWCGDWYGPRLLGGKMADPVAPNSAVTRTLRGGGWETGGRFCRSGCRYTIGPVVLRTLSSGFRPVLAHVEP